MAIKTSELELVRGSGKYRKRVPLDTDELGQLLKMDSPSLVRWLVSAGLIKANDIGLRATWTAGTTIKIQHNWVTLAGAVLLPRDMRNPNRMPDLVADADIIPVPHLNGYEYGSVGEGKR